VTVPLGVLKAGGIAFDPPLPAPKQAAIERLDMGNLEKVVLRFDEPFWLERGAAPTFLYIAETPGEFPGFTDWTDAAGAPTLVCLYGGRSAREVLDKWPDDEIAARAMQALREIFGADVPDPVATHVTRWRDDPWTLGSYSYLPVGASADDLRELGEPVEERLLFAGEATEPLLYATVHGALVSGLREARRIAGDAAALPGIDGTASAVDEGVPAAPPAARGSAPRRGR
jgi:monoamine oxidase